MNTVIILTICFIGFCVWLSLTQARLIYYPRRYLGDAPSAKWNELKFKTGQGWQRAYYARAGGGDSHANPPFVPAQLWVVFSGNAATASEWESFVSDYPDANTGFLLIDYPGYGFSQGQPSPESIQEAAAGAYEQLGLLIGKERLAALPTGILGHSLGAATGLVFASKLQTTPNRIVLIAPFTTMSAMARRALGWPLSLLLTHRFDNITRLRELIGRTPRPKVVIIHGTEDEVIPFELGRELAAAVPESRFVELRGALHNSAVERGRGQIIAAMTAE